MINEIKMVLKVGKEDYDIDSHNYKVKLMKNIGIENCIELYYNGFKINIINEYFDYYFFCKKEGIYKIILKFNIKMTDCEKLFAEYKNLISIDLSSFYAQEIYTMESMFLNCENLKSVNFSNFDSGKLTSMKEMFKGCINLEEIKFSSLNAINITDMSEMFCNCGLKYIQFPHINSKKLVNMEGMFSDCKNLKNVDFSSFITENVNNMSNLFKGCQNLEMIDFSKLNTRKVLNMSKMFMEADLKNIDLSTLNTENVKDLSYFFSKTKNLNNNHLSSLKLKKAYDLSKMFEGCDLNNISLSYIDAQYAVDFFGFLSECKNININKNSTLNLRKCKNANALFYKCDLSKVNFSFIYIKNVENMHESFYECKNIIINEKSILNIQNCLDISYMFYKCDLSNVNFSFLDIRNAENMNYCFAECKNIIINEKSILNAKNCIDASYMFYKCDLSNVNFSFLKIWNAENMDYFFAECKNITIKNDIHLYSKNCTNMDHMFYKCDLSNVNFSCLDIRNAEKMNYCFAECKNIIINEKSILKAKNCIDASYIFYKCDLSNVNFSFFDIRNAEILNFSFAESKNIIINDKSILKIKNCTSMKYTFNNSELKDLNFSFLLIENVQDMSYCFSGCKNIEINDKSHFDSKSVKDMRYIFSCSDISKINMAYLNTDNVENMDGFFSECKNIKDDHLSSLNTQNIVKMNYMFQGSDLQDLDLSLLNTNKVKDMTGFFANCKNITNEHLSSLNSKYVINMSELFEKCDLTNINVSLLYTKKVKYMNSMFSGTILTNTDFSSFDTNQVIDMELMFSYCQSMTDINFSHFNTHNVIKMNKMFYDCSLENIDISSFDVKNLLDIKQMFYNSDKLKSITLPPFYCQNKIEMESLYGNCNSLRLIKMWRTPNENFNRLQIQKRNLYNVKTIFLNDEKRNFENDNIFNDNNNLNQNNFNVNPFNIPNIQPCINNDINNMYMNNDNINILQSNNNFFNNNLPPLINMNNFNQFVPNNFNMNFNNNQNINNINPFMFNNNFNIDNNNININNNNNINPNNGF